MNASKTCIWPVKFLSAPIFCARVALASVGVFPGFHSNDLPRTALFGSP
jgi:hypothetical protein